MRCVFNLDLNWESPRHYQEGYFKPKCENALPPLDKIYHLSSIYACTKFNDAVGSSIWFWCWIQVSWVFSFLCVRHKS